MYKIHFDKIDSTNTFAKMNAGAYPLPALIIAKEQTAGKGRHGKSFYSPHSGIYFSIVFEADNGFDLITPAAAVCTRQAISELCGIETGIKWVNDLYLDGKKVCGILSERFACGDRMLTCVGIGINLKADKFPEDIPLAGSLQTDVEGDVIAEKTAKLLLGFNNGISHGEILKSYDEGLFIKGKTVTYEINNISYEGTVMGINDDCNLIVRKSDTTEDILSSGEISIKLR